MSLFFPPDRLRTESPDFRTPNNTRTNFSRPTYGPVISLKRERGELFSWRIGDARRRVVVIGGRHGLNVPAGEGN